MTPPPVHARWPIVLAGVAFVLFFVPGVFGPYGPFIDELYYVSCSRHLAWGYVDHPPLSIGVLRLAVATFGESLVVLRLVSATVGALVVGGTGLLARRLGAPPYGQALASLAVLTCSLMQVLFGFYSMNALEVLFWLALCWVVVDIAQTGNDRRWLIFGVVAGLALLNKHTVVVLAIGLAAALLATPARRHLRSPWLWTGAVIAILLLLPNLLWQQANGWPSLEFYRNAELLKNQPTSPLVVLLQQVLFVGPGVLPLTIGGLVLLLRQPAGADLRHLGVLYLVLLGLLMWSQQSRPDRIAGVYPLLFAAGGAWWGQRARHSRALRVAVGGWLMIWGAISLPIGVPILPPDALARYATALHAVPQIERGEGKRTALPQWFADRLGWQALVDDVVRVRAELSPDEQTRVMYFAPRYGQASALDWLGTSAGLAPVFCTHNSWFYWGPPAQSPEVAIVLGDDRAHLDALFGEVRQAAIHECRACMPWRNHMPIWVVRHPKVSIAERWAGWKHFE
jgi:4-amino-4-deoxy-L-arabinose transferase-like glycosyltransferase